MLGFGLGTLPALLLVGSGASGLNRLIQNQSIRTVAGIVLIGFGLYGVVSSMSDDAHHHAVVNVYPLQVIESIV